MKDSPFNLRRLSLFWLAAVAALFLTGTGADAYLFSFKAPAGARMVSVAGSFNGWNPSAAKMEDADGDGVWTAEVALPAGKHQYKFVVNGTDWLTDPANPNKTDDGLGGQNSVIEVAAAGAGAPATPPAQTPAAPQRGAASSAVGASMTVAAKPTFSYQAPAGTKSVAVAGSFNNWSTSATMLSDPSSSGVWTATVNLPAGKYQYKFVVNGSDWKEDPANPNKADDGLGGTNSVIEISGAASGTAASATPQTPAATMTATPAVANGMVDVTFTFSKPGPRTVHVAGEFNNWLDNDNGKVTGHSEWQMQKDASGNWTLTKSFKPGTYSFKYVIDGGASWEKDPTKPSTSDDNSKLVVTVGASATPSPAPAMTSANGMVDVTFTFSKPGPRTVHVAGEFNNWLDNDNGKVTGHSEWQMQKDASGNWTLTKSFKPGTYSFKYVIDGGASWEKDPTKPSTSDDNSKLVVTAGASATPSPAPAAAASSGAPTFSYKAPAGTRSVAVAGDFNNWSTSATMLTDPDGDGVWTATVTLSPGKHQYKFVVNGSDWKEDPANPNKADDGLGGSNSVIEGGAGGASAGAAAPQSAAPAAAGGPTFSYKAPAGTRSVAVAGDFNGWSTSATPMSDPDGDGVWTVTVPLPRGKHQYKFVVNGSDWKPDPANPNKADDGVGGENSVIEISAVGASSPAAVSPSNTMVSVVKNDATEDPANMDPSDLWAVDRPFLFSFRRAGAASVAVAGSFNNWSATANPMSDPSGSGVWTAAVVLPPGNSTYKFVVNGSEWLADPANSRREADGFGGENTIVTAGAGPDVVSHRGDGKIDAGSIEHKREPRYETRVKDDRAIFTLRLDRDDVESVSVVLADGSSVPLEIATRDDRYEYWRGEATVPVGNAPYHFELVDGASRFVVDRAGLSPRSTPSANESARPFVLAKGHVFATPEWAASTVVYQIFPDRFRDGDPTNDNANGDHARPWKYEALASAPSGWGAFYGGDLAGVIEKLDYIADLGATTVKLNPIFRGAGNHKYETIDYFRIDPWFGSNELFDRMIADGGARGMRFVLDGVFNHGSEHHPYFDDVREKGPASPYYSWYNIKAWPFGTPLSNYYETYGGFGGMPAWNTLNPAVKNYLFSAVDFWTKKGIGGWRLDVADAVEHEFWKDFRPLVKADNPEAWIVGEIWPSGAPWLQGDQFDATMNYPLRGAAIDFFAEEKIDASSFASRVAQLLVSIPPQAARVQFNMLSSHDTERFFTLAHRDKAKLRQAVAFQFSLEGAPVVYYGEEIGMEGGKDPDNRRAFPWDQPSAWQNDVRDFYKEMIALRKNHPALRAPVWNPLYAAGRVLIVATHSGTEKMILAFNTSDMASGPVAFDLPSGFPTGSYANLLGGAALDVSSAHVTIPSLSARQTSFYLAAV